MTRLENALNELQRRRQSLQILMLCILVAALIALHIPRPQFNHHQSLESTLDTNETGRESGLTIQRFIFGKD